MPFRRRSTSGTPPAAPELEPYDSPHHPMAAWFADMRRRRSEHYARTARRSAPPTRAVITIVSDEHVFLPIWLRYYSRFFAPGDIYVLDNGSSEAAVRDSQFTRIPAHHDAVDHVWMVKTIEELQHELVQRYDVVLVTDVDEIVLPDPRFGTLGDYIDRFDEEWVNCLGYELLHMREREPPLALDRPILEQRGYWFYNDGYDKAALASVPMSWKPGFHARSDSHFNLDPDLRMIHLHRMDYDICLERHRVRNRKQWADEDQRRRWALHNQIVDEEQFSRWFYEDSCFENLEIKIERIPDSWRSAF